MSSCRTFPISFRLQNAIVLASKCDDAKLVLSDFLPPDKPALSFQFPEIPTSHNFDRLVQEFGGAAFGPETDLSLTVKAETQPAPAADESSGYKVRSRKLLHAVL